MNRKNVLPRLGHRPRATCLRLLLLAFIFQFAAFRLSAQDPSPSPRPSPVPPIGYIAGINSSGTAVWNAPVWVRPLIYGHNDAVFVTGSAVPTLAAVQLALAQRAATRSLTSSYATTLAAGITVTSGSLSMRLAAEPSDQQQFNELLALLNTAPMPATLIISDVNGNAQTVTVTQYYALIGSYGQQIASLWTAFATAKSAVASASGTAALAKITLADPTGE